MNEGPERESQRLVDDLLAKAKALKDRATAGNDSDMSGPSAHSASITDATNSIRALSDNIGFLRRSAVNVKETLVGLHERFFAPVWRVFSPLGRCIWRIYGRFWTRFSYKTNPANGERVISRARSSCVVAITILFLSIFTPTGLGDRVRFVTTEPILDSILIAATLHTETYYLNDTQEINPEENEHAVRGCRTIGQCGEQDAMYFRVRPRLAHDFWKLSAHGSFFYIPDHVVAPIAPGINKCEVTYYGYRLGSSWISRLLRSLQIYPTMLEADCRYVGSNEAAKGLSPLTK